jgi:hypothetical protein
LIHDVQAGKHTAAHAALIDREAMVELLRCREANITACLSPDGVSERLLVDDLATAKIGWFRVARSSTGSNYP